MGTNTIPEISIENRNKVQEMTDSAEKVKKHKSPSKAARDWLRARMYWGQTCGRSPRRRGGGEVRDVQTQTEGLFNSESGARGGMWKKLKTVFEKKRKDANNDIIVPKRFESSDWGLRENGGLVPEPLPQEPARDQECVTVEGRRIDPGRIYEITEDKMRMSRLEEEKNLIRALRHLVRSVHEGGKSIAFAVPEAVDRIHLRCCNLPTDPGELMVLVLRVFARRQEPFSLDGIYADFVKSSGKVVFDNRQPWPQCYAVVRHP